MIDCHLHLQDLRLAESPDGLAGIVSTLRSVGVRRLVVNGTSPGDWAAVERLAQELPEAIPSFGLHPWRTDGAPADWLIRLETLLSRHPGAGVGEIGLDRWIRPRDFGRQKEAFLAQLDLAKRFRRPTTIHCLEAWGSLLESLESAMLPRPALLHSYGGPREMVPRFLDLGCYFSISGYFFRPEKAHKLAVFDGVPQDRILLETDAPDMLPPPEMVRFPIAAAPSGEGKAPNHPANLAAIYERWATHHRTSLADLIAQTERNFQDWLGTYPATSDSSISPSATRP